jgi:hypothetical protein
VAGARVSSVPAIMRDVEPERALVNVFYAVAER